MRYLLDTNVISETRRMWNHADSGARDWLERTPADQWQVSVLTDYELELGVVSMHRRDVVQASVLRRWLADARRGYQPRLLPVTVEIARICAEIQVPDRHPLGDALIAATALRHGLTVVTRNEKDFDVPGLAVLNPFSGR